MKKYIIELKLNNVEKEALESAIKNMLDEELPCSEYSYSIEKECIVWQNDYTKEEIAKMKEIPLKRELSYEEENLADYLGIAIYENGDGLYNEVMLQQALFFKKKYEREFAEEKYDFALADTAVNFPEMLGDVGDVIEIKNDIAVYHKII